MELDGVRVYFPFPDGAWRYDCVSCGGLCCKGKGTAATSEEYAQIKTRYPSIQPFARSGDAQMVGLVNLPGGCFFLEESGLCCIEKDLGRDSKPFVCKTFPFNEYDLSEETLIVGPGSLCPLQLESDATSGVVVRHADLLRDIHIELRILQAGRRAAQAKNPVRDGTGSRAWTAKMLEFEEWSRDLERLAHFPNNLQLWAAQAASSERFPSTVLPDAAAVDQWEERLVSFAERTAHFFAFSSVASAQLFDNPRMRSLTALVRLYLLRRLFFLPFADVVELASPALVILSQVAHQAETLASRALSLQETAVLCQRYLLASLLGQFVDWKPWLDDEHSDTLELPAMSGRTSAFVDLINPNSRLLTMAELFEEAGIETVEQRLFVFDELAATLRWLRFSPPG